MFSRPTAVILRQKRNSNVSIRLTDQQKMELILYDNHVTGPDSLVVRASVSGSVDRGFAPRPRHTKGVKNGTGSSLADARNKRVVLGRYKNAGWYLLLVMSQ